MTERSVDKKTEALKLALGYMDGTLMTEHLTGYERKRHVMQSIREALAEQCVCGEPDTFGTHRTDGPCLAEQPAPATPLREQQEPVAFLANGTRFKISYDSRQSGGQIHGIPPELGGRWVAFVAADDDCHLKLTSPPASKPWVPLTDEDIDQGLLRSNYAFKTAEAWRAGVVFATTKLKEKNT